MCQNGHLPETWTLANEITRTHLGFQLCLPNRRSFDCHTEHVQQVRESAECEHFQNTPSLPKAQLLCLAKGSLCWSWRKQEVLSTISNCLGGFFPGGEPRATQSVLLALFQRVSLHVRWMLLSWSFGPFCSLLFQLLKCVICKILWCNLRVRKERERLATPLRSWQECGTEYS